MNNVEYIESSNRIPSLIDPATGEVRPAGSFSNAEWKRIVKDNPDAATLILQLRRRENEIEALEGIANNSIGAGIGAVSAGISYPLLNAIAPEIGQRLSDEWRNRTWAKLDDTIYKNDNVVLKTTGAPGGGIELLVDGRTRVGDTPASWKTKENVIEAINKALPGYLASPGKGRAYFAVAENIDALGTERTARMKEAGFQAKELGGRGLYTIDKRPGAEFLGRGYDLIDDLVFRDHLLRNAGYIRGAKDLTPQLAKSSKILKGLRFAGALTGALGLGSLIGGGVNFINERI